MSPLQSQTHFSQHRGNNRIFNATGTRQLEQDMSHSGIKITEIQIKDINVLYKTREENSSEDVNKEDTTQESLSGTMLLATSQETGEIVGRCFTYITNGKGTICGLVANSRNLRTQIALFEKAYDHLQDVPIDAILHYSMRAYMRNTSFVRRWDILIYEARFRELSLPIVDNDSYVIETEENCRSYFCVKCHTSPGETIQVFLDYRNINSVTCFKLHSVTDCTSINGCGVICKDYDENWMIGPVIAQDLEGAKLLFKEIINYVKNTLKRSVLLYVIDCGAERNALIREFGFRKCLKEWTRYSTREFCGRTPFGLKYNDAKKIIFALETLHL